jgi:hypothetical protein
MLNKRYKNQPVAVKKKIDLTHHCDVHCKECENAGHDIFEFVRNAMFDKQEQIDSSTDALRNSALAAENKLYEWYVNEISNGNLNPHPITLDDFTNPMSMSYAVWFTVMFPIYASYRVQQTATDLGITDALPVTAMTEDIKTVITDFANREATSHMNTIRTDIENALAIIRSKTSDPQEIKSMFAQAFADIQARRAMAIADNAAARIFNLSQYEADLQFLTRAGKLNQAYKVLFSLTGDPCPICAAMIAQSNASPIPFTNAFAEIGDTVEAEGKHMTFSYESIIAGNVHPNCRCAYRLVIQEDVA